MARRGRREAGHLAMRIVANYLAESIRHRIVSLTFEDRLTGYDISGTTSPCSIRAESVG